MHYFNTTCIHKSWLPILEKAFNTLDPNYLQELAKDEIWLPGKEKVFSAFNNPLTSIKYIL